MDALSYKLHSYEQAWIQSKYENRTYGNTVAVALEFQTMKYNLPIDFPIHHLTWDRRATQTQVEDNVFVEEMRKKNIINNPLASKLLTVWSLNATHNQFDTSYFKKMLP